MSANPANIVPPASDVALLVDWENLKFSLAQRERRPNVTALRDAAERFGRVVYARAYADWQDPVHSGDPARLYLAGLEPVYVLTKRYTDNAGDFHIKNSVDVKLAADCIEASHAFPNVGTYIIVSGDHGFLHVVNTLRPHGKRVVIIGVSWTTAAQLTDQADVVLYYDLDVEPSREAVQDQPPTPTPVISKNLPPAIVRAADVALKLMETHGNPADADQRKIAEALELVMTVTREYRSARREFSVSLLGQELQKRMNPSDFARFGKGRARIFAQALEAGGFLRLVSRDFVDWLFLPDEPQELISAAVPLASDLPRYDYAGFVFSDLAPEKRDAIIQAVNDERLRPGIQWLTFNRIQGAVHQHVQKDDHSVKNLVNNMIAIGVLRADAERDGRGPDGSPYRYRSFTLDLQNPDVRRALKLG